MSGKLKPVQRRAIINMLSEPSIEAAAQATGIADRTIYRWLNTPEFRQALEAAEIEALGTAARLLANSAAKAANYLDSVIDDDQATVTEKIRACAVLLERMPAIRYVGSFEARLKKLLDALNVQHQWH